MRQTMELGELLNILVKRKWIVIGSAIVFMIIGIIYSAFISTPVYRADTTLVVRGANSGLDLDIGTIDVNQKIAVTYGKIVKSRAVLQRVIDELKLKTSYEKFSPRVSAAPVDNTEILRISVKDESKEQAIKIADKIAEVFKEESKRTVNVDNMAILDSAAATENTVNRSPLKVVILAILAGIVIGTLLTLLADYMDNTLKTEEDIEKYLNLSVIGSVPDFKVIEKKEK